MPSFSKSSIDKLQSCNRNLQLVFLEVVARYDCTAICGHRDQEAQDTAFAEKRSRVKWPFSKHNTLPSNAIDIVPYPINWGNIGTEVEKRKAIARFYHFAGYVKRVAEEKGVSLRWGGDWDGDGDFSDQSFDDLPHWEEVINEPR